MHIVHVDDDIEYCSLVEHLLTDAGLSISQAQTVDDAWKRIIAEQKVLVLCDHRLENESGVELVERLRAAGRHDHFVLMTGLANSKIREEAIAAGANAVVEKPMGLGALETMLKTTVANAMRSPAEVLGS